MMDATVATSKPIFLEMSITHTPHSDSALSTIINNFLFKQAGFFSLEYHSLKFPSVLHVH